MVILKKIQESWILSLLAPTNFGGLGIQESGIGLRAARLGSGVKWVQGAWRASQAGRLGELRASWRMAWRSGAASVTVPRNEVE